MFDAAGLSDIIILEPRGVADADLGIEARCAHGGLGLDDDDDAAGVLARHRVGDLDRVVDVDEIGNADEQREDTAEGS